MCKSDLEIHFCICASIQKEIFPSPHLIMETNRAEYEKTQFIWQLSHYIGKKDSGMMGEMIMPVDQLDQDLTAHFLTKQLNSRNIFDFDYSPTEGDNLEFREEYIYKKVKGEPRPDLYNDMSFIFRNGAWIDDVYDVFNDKIKGFKKGNIKYIPQE